MAQVVQPAGRRRLASLQPVLAGQAALPGAGGEAEDLGLDRAALERAGENVGANGGHHDRPAAHGAGIVDQDGDHRVAELGVLFLLERQRRGRVDDHPGQPRHVQHPFLQIEGPGAVLLGQQLALQPVGQARDDVGQAGQLLVEIGAQAAEFLGVAQLLGAHHLVMGGGEDLVGRLAVAGVLDIRPRGLFAVAHFDVVVRGFGILVGLGLGALLFRAVGVAVGTLGRIRLGAFAVLVLVLAHVVLDVAGHFRRVALAGILGVVAELLAQVEVLDDRARHAGEGGLILKLVGQPVEIGAGLGLDIGAVALHQQLGPVGRRVAGQPLAHHQPDNVGQGGRGRIVEAVQALLLNAGFQRRGQVGAYAHQRIGPDRVDAGLLDRLEDRAGLHRLGPQLGVGGLVVVGEAQRHLVGQAADARGLLRRQVARRVRQDGVVAVQRRPVAGEGDLQIRLLGQRTRRVRDRPLEDLGRVFSLRSHGQPS